MASGFYAASLPVGHFTPTVWSTVLKAQEGDEESRLAALNRLLTRYRRPVIQEIQFRRRCCEADAEDLAHKFIETCLRRDFLKEVNPVHGRFRGFLKTCIGNFLKDLHDRETAQKRGAGIAHVSLQETDEEGRNLYDAPATQRPPAYQMDKAWAAEVLQASMEQLEIECANVRRASLFAALKSVLGSEKTAESLASIGTRLGMTEEAVKGAAYRMRRRLGEIIAEQVQATVGTHDDWKEELRYLVELMEQ